MTIAAAGPLQVATQQTPTALFAAMCQKVGGGWLLVYRRGNNHLSFDGELYCRHQIAGTLDNPTWGSELLVYSHSPGTYDIRGGIPRLLPDGRIGILFWETLISGGARVLHRSGSIESTDASATSFTGPTLMPNHFADQGNANEGPLVIMPNGDWLAAVYECKAGQTIWSVVQYRRPGGVGAWVFDTVIVESFSAPILYEEPWLLPIDNGDVLCFIRQVDGGGQYTHLWRSTNGAVSYVDEGPVKTQWPQGSRIAAAQHPLTGTIMLHHRSVGGGGAFSAAGGYTWAPSPGTVGTWANHKALDTDLALSSPSTPPMYSYGDTRPLEAGGFAAVWTNETPRSGFGQPEIMFRTFADDAPIIVDDLLTLDADDDWDQDELDLTVTAGVGVRATVGATVVSERGGRLQFAGAHAARFAASLDGSSWASTLELDAGETRIYLSALPELGDTTLTATLGVPR